MILNAAWTCVFKVHKRKPDGKPVSIFPLAKSNRKNTVRSMYELLMTPEFARWFFGMKDLDTRTILQRRLDRVKRGALGDVAPVGEGVFEMREFTGAGWRMYYIQRGKRLLYLLCGGDVPA